MLKYAVAILLFTSCSANWHLNRAIKKDPSLLKGGDTVLVHDTAITTKERVLYDSFVTTEYDTVTIEDSFVYTQVIRKDNVIKVYTKCKSDTVRITTKIPFQLPPKVVKAGMTDVQTAIWSALILLLLIIIIRFVSK
jgi:hypothetical protein